MTEEAQRIAIAEVCGWVWYRIPTPAKYAHTRRYRCLFLPAVHEYEGQLKEWLVRADMTEGICNRDYLWREGMVPNYPKDLNAIHEAEKALIPPWDARKPTDAKQRYWAYQLELSRVTRAGDSDKGPLAIITATAAQRLEALLRVLGLWK